MPGALFQAMTSLKEKSMLCPSLSPDKSYSYPDSQQPAPGTQRRPGWPMPSLLSRFSPSRGMALLPPARTMSHARRRHMQEEKQPFMCSSWLHDTWESPLWLPQATGSRTKLEWSSQFDRISPQSTLPRFILLLNVKREAQLLDQVT